MELSEESQMMKINFNIIAAALIMTTYSSCDTRDNTQNINTGRLDNFINLEKTIKQLKIDSLQKIDETTENPDDFILSDQWEGTAGGYYKKFGWVISSNDPQEQIKNSEKLLADLQNNYRIIMERSLLKNRYRVTFSVSSDQNQLSGSLNVNFTAEVTFIE